jgi:hypothetical protein
MFAAFGRWAAVAKKSVTLYVKQTEIIFTFFCRGIDIRRGERKRRTDKKQC